MKQSETVHLVRANETRDYRGNLRKNPRKIQNC